MHDTQDISHVAMDWVNETNFIEDGYHFNLEGHRLFADQLMQVVEVLLRKKSHF